MCKLNMPAISGLEKLLLGRSIVYSEFTFNL
jgi:hypothetical protein